jgi:hypothetical protein
LKNYCNKLNDKSETFQMTLKKIKDTEEAWDKRKLGAEVEFVGVADASHEVALQDALDLQVIPVRLVEVLDD